jgi:hypothetical protein
MASMWREALKDVRETMNQTFFGQRDGGYEPGTPLAPTQAMVTHDLGFDAILDLYASRGASRESHHEHGREL